jgi:hypothetical protein
VCSSNFKNIPASPSERIRFLATAYNTGFWKSEDEICQMEDRKYYSTRLISKEYYSYSDISLYWFLNSQKNF